MRINPINAVNTSLKCQPIREKNPINFEVGQKLNINSAEALTKNHLGNKLNVIA